METFQSIADYTHWRQQLPPQQAKVAFVPTMGNLHGGHLSLVEKAKSLADVVVVSIFVNPLQFAPTEDFATYPRTLKADKLKLAALNVDALFTPFESELYPKGRSSEPQIEVSKIAQRLCGVSRPHFFQGVATVVHKLFNIIHPSVAIFGEKDFQQLLVIKTMVQDLKMPVDIVSGAIVREKDGLAMSSRNQNLSSQQREKAKLLYQALKSAKAKIIQGEPIEAVTTESRQGLTKAGFNVDYFEVLDERNLQAATKFNETMRIFVAAKLGDTRLIDNL